MKKRKESLFNLKKCIMQKAKCLLFLAIILCASGVMAQSHFGTNLSPINDYSPQFIFKDAFKASREWIPFNADGSGGWTSGVNIPLRTDGYPLEIPYNDGINPAQSIRSLVLWDLSSGYPAGTYTLHLEGTGSVKLIFGATGTFSSPGTYTFTPNGGNFGIEIISSDVSDPIHKIEIVMPGFNATYQAEPFHPSFMNFISNFEVLRFMDLMETNDSPLVTWSDRSAEVYHTQASNFGMAYEYMVQIANDANKDIWICIPHKADDNYISQLASFLQTNLNANLTIYVEYSNEVWNGDFLQNGYAAQQATNLGYTGQPWERTWQYYAKRTADVFYLFEQVFGANSSRLIKTIGSISINSWISGQIIDHFNDLTYNPNGVTADALAIAPYFGVSIANEIGDNGEINSITVDQILDRLEADLPAIEADIIAQKTVADNKNLQLITYEAGQHLVAGAAYEGNATLTQKLNDTNRHARMETIYCDYFGRWYDNVPNGILLNFSSYTQYGQSGSWGIKEYMGQPSSTAPKYLAFENCLFPAPLAVDLISFNAALSFNKSVLIDWESYQEDGLNHYAIQRSSDNISFETIAKITPNDKQYYHLEDYAPLPEDSYYRLKMVNSDGSFHYSAIKSIYLEEKYLNAINVFPNPFHNEISITYHRSNDNGNIQILDINGQVLQTVPAYQKNIFLGNLHQGIYFVKYTSWYQTQIIKIIKTE